MLNEIGADFAVMKTLTQTAEREVNVGQYSAITFLNDELIEERETARARIIISLITIGAFRHRQGGGDAFEVHGGGVAGRV